MSNPNDSVKIMIEERKREPIDKKIDDLLQKNVEIKKLIAEWEKRDTTKIRNIDAHNRLGREMREELAKNEKYIRDNTTPDDFAVSLPEVPKQNLMSTIEYDRRKLAIQDTYRHAVSQVIKEVAEVHKSAPRIEFTEKSKQQMKETLLEPHLNKKNSALKSLYEEFQLRNGGKEIGTSPKYEKEKANYIASEKKKLEDINTKIAKLEADRSKSKTGSSNVFSRGLKGFGNITGLRKSSVSKLHEDIHSLRSKALGIDHELEILSGKKGGRKTKKRRRKTKKGRRKTRNCKP